MLLLIWTSTPSLAQEPVLDSNLIEEQTIQLEKDSTKMKRIEIINTDVFNFMTTDSNTIRSFNGNVLFHHEGTDFYCNSAMQYMDTEIVVAIGDVHIQKPDSFDIWADYLVYYSKEKLARFRGNVVFQDSTAKLLTDSLDFDLNTSIGNFWSGGTFITDSSTLTSDRGTYYHHQNEAYFYDDVHLENPEFDLYSDSMRYDTETQIAYFISATKIVNDKDVIYTESGSYDTKNNTAKFDGRTNMTSGSTRIEADSLYYNKEEGYGEASSNVIWEDTAEQIIIVANYAEYEDSLSYVMATGDPFLVDVNDDDTMYMSADTLYTFKLPRYGNEVSTDTISNIDSTAIDTIQQKGKLEVESKILDEPFIDTTVKEDFILLIEDTLRPIEPDFFISEKDKLDSTVIGDSLQQISDTIVDEIQPLKQTDTISAEVFLDTIYVEQDLSILDDSIRIFYAFEKTKVIQGRMSAICDSFYYSTKDSIFRMHRSPMVWMDTSQFSGETIVMELKNKKVDRILINKTAFIAKENGPNIYDQTAGKEIIGYMKNNDLVRMEILGNGESIYFIQDDSSAFVGGNKSICSKMNIFMDTVQDQVDHILFITKPEATFTPFQLINLGSYRLPGFVWKFDLKPKSVEDVSRSPVLYQLYLDYIAGKYPKSNKILTPEIDIEESSSKQKIIKQENPKKEIEVKDYKIEN